MAKQPKRLHAAAAVRTRRAYFDCRFGQLHVRTAFPMTGGFDEGTTVFCLHPNDQSSRLFTAFLAQIATVRPAFAPDLPGWGESDPGPTGSVQDAAAAIGDLADDLRLRQIDVLGFRFGAAVALELAAARASLVRRLVLAGMPPVDSMPVIPQESLVLRSKFGTRDDSQWTDGVLAKVKFLDLTSSTSEILETDSRALAIEVGAFLGAANVGITNAAKQVHQ